MTVPDITTARARFRPLAEFIDAQGHRVTATVTSSGLLAVIAADPDEGIRDGHPCLSLENAAVLLAALEEFIDGGGSR